MAVLLKGLRETVASVVDRISTQPDLFAFVGLPKRHRRQIWSTKTLELVNKEIKGRTDIGGVSPRWGSAARGQVGRDRPARRVGSQRMPLIL